MAKELKADFASEAELCRTFIAQLPAGWVAYPETAGFDILLVRIADGAQIGVEAKQTLNAKVLLQVLEGREAFNATDPGPDFRAVLVPHGKAGSELCAIARHLSVTVIQMKTKDIYQELRQRYGVRVDPRVRKFEPALPVAAEERWRMDWFDCCPWVRETVPEYVPDVAAGASSPSQLTDWKIRAIKICILLDRTGYLTRHDFKEIRINYSRFLEMRWIRPSDERGKYVVGPRPLNLRLAHPTVYPQIEADFDKWAPKNRPEPPLLQKQEIML